MVSRAVFVKVPKIAKIANFAKIAIFRENFSAKSLKNFCLSEYHIAFFMMNYVVCLTIDNALVLNLTRAWN